MLFGFATNTGIQIIEFDTLGKYMNLRNCKCGVCGIYFKRDRLRLDPNDRNIKICQTDCSSELYRS